jgi:hypothetical protein
MEKEINENKKKAHCVIFDDYSEKDMKFIL